MGQGLTSPASRRSLRLAIAVGLVLLVSSPVLRFWVTPALAQSPVDPGDGTFQTFTTTGSITSLFDLATQRDISDEVQAATRIISVRGDVDASRSAEGDGHNVAVVDTIERMVTDDGRLIHEATMRLATDRHTQALVDCCEVQVAGVSTAMAGSGSPLRLPWFTPARTYPYFDPTLLAAVPMAFIGTDELAGMPAWKFQQVTNPTAIGTVRAPGRLVDSEQETVPLTRTHAVTRTLWVDPTTGIILRKQERVRETLRDDVGRDIVALLAMDLASTPEQETAQRIQARGEGIPVRWAHTYGPATTLVSGALLLVGGLVGTALRTRQLRVQRDFPDEIASFEDLRDSSQQP